MSVRVPICMHSGCLWCILYYTDSPPRLFSLQPFELKPLLEMQSDWAQHVLKGGQRAGETVWCHGNLMPPTKDFGVAGGGHWGGLSTCHSFLQTLICSDNCSYTVILKVWSISTVAKAWHHLLLRAKDCNCWTKMIKNTPLSHTGWHGHCRLLWLISTSTIFMVSFVSWKKSPIMSLFIPLWI